MKKILIVMLVISSLAYELCAADRTPVMLAAASHIRGVQITACEPQIAQVAQLAQKVVMAQAQEKNLAKGETPSALIKQMRKQAEGSASKESSLAMVYLKAHEQAVIAGNTEAAHILAVEKENAERGWYHRWISGNPKLVTALEVAIPAVVAFVVVFWLQNGARKLGFGGGAGAGGGGQPQQPQAGGNGAGGPAAAGAPGGGVVGGGAPDA